jgi:5-methylcytosine-specific restriction endonuclease McrA
VVRKAVRDWEKANPEKRGWYRRKAKQSIDRARPPWIDSKALSDIYNNCPPGMEVDHIVPLRGKNVSGLHVPWNLQYLTAQENRRKGNSFERKAA